MLRIYEFALIESAFWLATYNSSAYPGVIEQIWEWPELHFCKKLILSPFGVFPGTFSTGLLTPRWLAFPRKVTYLNWPFLAVVHSEHEPPQPQQKLPSPPSIPSGPYKQLGNCSSEATELRNSEPIMMLKTLFVIQHRLHFHDCKNYRDFSHWGKPTQEDVWVHYDKWSPRKINF